MERIFTYPITHNEKNIPIDRFLRSMGFSASNMIALKKIPEGILINGRWEYVNYRLQPEDTLTVRLIENKSSEKIVPVPLPLDIRYEDEDILVVNKPADMPIHPSQNNYENTLANAVMYYYHSQKIPFVFRCVNRLDRDTTGLTVIAKHAVSAGILSSAVAKRELAREYLAIVPRFPSATESDIPALSDSGIINKPIGRKPGSTIERFIDYENGETAITHYQKLCETKAATLLSLHLETGRTHQIRVHMASMGYPLLGDDLYGGDMSLIQRQALHSYRLRFRHPINGKWMEFTEEMPGDMGKVMDTQIEI